MTASFPNWRKEVPCKVSGESPIIYISKLTKTEVIPIYRLAYANGESQDVVCYLCASWDKDEKRYMEQIIFPAVHLLSAGEPIIDHIQMELDMIHNCKALGIEIQDGIKEDNWKQFSPIISNPARIPTDNLLNFYEKVKTVSLEDITIQEKTGINNPSELVTTEGVEIKDSEKMKIISEIPIKIKTERVSVNKDESVTINEPAFHFDPQPKGKRGRPRKVYDDPVFDALVRSIPHATPCKGCGKDIILVPLNIIDRARALKIEVSELVSNYRCRSCKAGN